MENWLAILVGGFLLGMVLYGHYKGFIHMAVTLTALILSFVAVKVITPDVTVFLKEKTPIYETVKTKMEESFGLDEEDIFSEEQGTPAMQREMIENLNIPSELKKVLLENNNNEVYHMLGVNKFGDYIINYITMFVIHIVSYVLTFVVVYILVRFILRCVDLIARLPILNGMNQLAGAALGAAHGLLIVWIAFLMITAFSGTPFGRDMMTSIEENRMLSFLYDNNLLCVIVTESMRHIV